MNNLAEAEAIFQQFLNWDSTRLKIEVKMICIDNHKNNLHFFLFQNFETNITGSDPQKIPKYSEKYPCQVQNITMGYNGSNRNRMVDVLQGSIFVAVFFVHF